MLRRCDSIDSWGLSRMPLFPAAIHDGKAAVRWLRANATKYGLNPDKIGAIGSSAGGHLAAAVSGWSSPPVAISLMARKLEVATMPSMAPCWREGFDFPET